MNMSLFFGLEDENPNAEAESQQSENTSSTEDDDEHEDNRSEREKIAAHALGMKYKGMMDRGLAKTMDVGLHSANNESEECGDDPAEATESFICESLGISSDELDYFSSEEFRENFAHSLEIGRIQGFADDMGFTKAGREKNIKADIADYRDKSTLFCHKINKKFRSLAEALKSSEVKRFVDIASNWRTKHEYQTAKIPDIIKAEPDNFDSKNLYNIGDEVVYITRHGIGKNDHYDSYKTYYFELKLVYIKNKNPNAKPKGMNGVQDTKGVRAWIAKNFDKDTIQTKGFCVVMCDNDDQSIRRKNLKGRFYD